MSNGDPRQVLDEAGRCLADLRRILDAAMNEAVFNNASDIERIRAAKAATEHAAATVEELRKLLLGENGEKVAGG